VIYIYLCIAKSV